jgi:hypothetical protein
MNGWTVGDGGRILHTTNGGSTWSGQMSGTTSFLASVYFSDAMTGWAVGRGGTILHTASGPSSGGGVGVPPTAKGLFIYSAKFVCGTSRDIKKTSVAQGMYGTVVSIHNFTDTTITVWKKAVLALTQFDRARPPTTKLPVKIGPDGAFEVDCREISQWFNLSPDQFATGFVVIESPVRLDVVAVYTSEGLPGLPPSAPSIDVEYVPESHHGEAEESGLIIIHVVIIVIVIFLIIIIIFLLRRK